MFYTILPLVKGFSEDRGVSLAMGAVSTLLLMGFVVSKQREYALRGEPFGSTADDGRRARKKKVR